MTTQIGPAKTHQENLKQLSTKDQTPKKFIMGGAFGEFISKLAGIMFFCSTVHQFFPHRLQICFENLCDRLMSLFYPYIRVKFEECTNGRRNEAYGSIKNYLGSKSSKKGKYLKGDMSGNSKSLAISLDEGDEIVDEYNGVKLWWQAYNKTIQDTSSRRPTPYEKHYYVLTFKQKYQEIVTRDYLNYVMEEGKMIEFRNRKRRLYANNNGDDWYWKGGSWSYLNFEHPATFDTLAMDPKKKEEIINDLTNFSKGKDYYAKIGKAWKRGYLLFGPPGSGKSTMIAAIANFLEYDIYDLELTSVKDNAELKQLLIETKNKSIIVIEDIDCSIDLTGKRNKKKESSENVEEKKNLSSEQQEKEKTENKSRVTLSGLLNFIDGIWSACGQERIIIFTTNHVDKLDPALIRRGRMDLHIEMSYCKFEAFKVLAKNYLDIDSHTLFAEIENLLDEINMSPCDVAENLMPKTDSKDAEHSLSNLILALKNAKEKASLDKLQSQENEHALRS